MYGQYVEFAGYTVWVWCCPKDTLEVLRKLAEQKIQNAKDMGLKGCEFMRFLKGY